MHSPPLGQVLAQKGVLRGVAMADYFHNRLEKGADPNDSSRNGHRILQLVIRDEQLDPQLKFKLVKLLVEFGTDLNTVDKSSLTPFQAAVAIRDRTIADFLVVQGARRLVPPGTGYVNYYDMYRQLP